MGASMEGLSYKAHEGHVSGSCQDDLTTKPLADPLAARAPTPGREGHRKAPQGAALHNDCLTPAF